MRPALRYGQFFLDLCFFTKRLQVLPFLTKLGVYFSSRRDASVCKASAQSELTEGRFQCFFTNRLQSHSFLTKIGVFTSSHRDASVRKASAQSEPIDSTNQKNIPSETKKSKNKQKIHSSVIISHHESSCIIMKHHESSRIIIIHHHS